MRVPLFLVSSVMDVDLPSGPGMTLPWSTVQSHLETFPSYIVKLERMRDWSAKLYVPDWQTAFGLHELGAFEKSGLHPPRQYSLAAGKQKPYSEQHGFAEPHFCVALHVC
jgi:hypothetical protein